MNKMYLIEKIEMISGNINRQFDDDILLCNNAIWRFRLIISTIEKGLEKIVERKILALFFVAILGIGLRVYFMPWDYPTNSPDAFVFMNEAINYSKGNFEQFNIRFIWPMFLSLFFQFSDNSDLAA